MKKEMEMCYGRATGSPGQKRSPRDSTGWMNRARTVGNMPSLVGGRDRQYWRDGAWLEDPKQIIESTKCSKSI